MEDQKFKSRISEIPQMNNCYLVDGDIFEDHRGTMYTSYNDGIDLGEKKLIFSHDKFSESNRGVLRGIHGDSSTWKLVRCVYGELFQVIVDCREDEDSFGSSYSIMLNGNTNKALLIPPGFGNAFQVISPTAIYHYKLCYKGLYKDADQQFTYAWDDSRFNIKWPIVDNLILSDRDGKNKG